ncbi:hypothetical protein TeGR_g10222 [Tetraparma gracilis]|uniref:cGMP-dependent protein kinase n=1 Tax=Tetraparma gracilis TaxID=2962635 RepID=A0ABQ6M8T4_9STRA|nr:hypothetical protein TeGR_g10222 [Tetraparma gracilis]
MSGFSSRGSRSTSEPPERTSFGSGSLPSPLSGGRGGKRDSMSNLDLTRPSPMKKSESMGQSFRVRKNKKNQLFGESLDVDAFKGNNKKIIAKPDSSREIIANALLAHFLFSRLPDDEIITLVDAMERHPLQAGDAVIKQGDVGDYFYVVEEGDFEITVNGEHVGDVEGGGGTFGELALMHNSPRAATIVAKNSALLWGLDRNTFRCTLAATAMNGLDEIKEFLGKVEILEGLDPSQMSTLAQAVDVQKWSKGEMIVRKGEVGNEMYVLKEGSVVCKVLKGGGEGGDDGESRVQSIKTLDINLKVGDYFGERALMYHEVRAADVLATSDVVCYTISKSVFDMVLGSLKDLLEQNLRMTLLKSLDVFAALDPSDLNGVAKALVPMEFEEDDEVICAGYQADHFFLIRTGHASLECSDGVPLTLGPGECFGEEALTGNSKYSMTVSSVDDLECLVLMASTLVDLGISLPNNCLARLRVASEGRFKNSSHASRQSFGAAELQKMIDDTSGGGDGDYDDGDEIHLDVKSISELETGRTLGTGSFGRVKVSKHMESETVFALKILQKEAIRVTRQEKNIINEKELTANLQHPFILHLYGTFQDTDCLYMMLEIVMGGELFRLLHGDGSVENKLSSQDTAFYAANVVSVYEYIHAQNVTYRDLKPENILIAADGYLKVVDWGFAKKVVDKTFTTCGTPEYLAPELVQGTGHNKGVDLWALGILIFEMLVGRTPFVGNDPDDTMAICRNIMNETIEYPEDFEESAADLIEGLCTREVLARLGCMKNGCDDVKGHVFFESINWKDLKRKKVPAPWKPTVNGAMDVSNFDDIYDDEEEIIEEYSGDQAVFANF